MRPRLLLVDNYDSFTYNLAHGLHVAGADVDVRANDQVPLARVLGHDWDGIVLSPGPGHPAVPRDFGACTDIVRALPDLPMLGVCLGMQGMAQHTGGRVVQAAQPVHGSATEVTLAQDDLFAGLPRTLQAGRYHSLVVDAAHLPLAWLPIAQGDGLLMAMRHRRLPWWGVQFHPESILTPQGPRMLANFVDKVRSR